MKNWKSISMIAKIIDLIGLQISSTIFFSRKKVVFGFFVKLFVHKIVMIFLWISQEICKKSSTVVKEKTSVREILSEYAILKFDFLKTL